MQQTHFFFSSVVDLKYHSLSEHHMNAMYAVYGACRAINQPSAYGSSIETISIDAIHQDYDSGFHPAVIQYNPVDRRVEAGVKVDLDQVLESDFAETVAIYQEVIFQVLDQIKDQAPDFDFDQLKVDLQQAIREEIEVMK